MRFIVIYLLVIVWAACGKEVVKKKAACTEIVLSNVIPDNGYVRVDSVRIEDGCLMLVLSACDINYTMELYTDGSIFKSLPPQLLLVPYVPSSGLCDDLYAQTYYFDLTTIDEIDSIKKSVLLKFKDSDKLILYKM